MGNWQAVRTGWAPLPAQVRQMMDSGVHATDPGVQSLAQHWMGLIHHWPGGDFDLIERWGRTSHEDPLARSAHGPDPDLLRYIEQATALRMAAWQRHFGTAEMSRFRRVEVGQWNQPTRAAEALIATGLPPTAAPARALASPLQAPISRVVGDDPVLLPAAALARAKRPRLRVVAAWLAPQNLRSCHDPMMGGPLRIPPWLPMTLRRLSWRRIDRRFIDPAPLPDLNAARLASGLAPVPHFMPQLQAVADQSITLFPDWFARSAPDWPQPMLRGSFVRATRRRRPAR